MGGTLEIWYVHFVMDCVLISSRSPNVSSWEEHGAYHIIAQIESRMNKKPLNTWRSEVLAAREVRNRFQQETEGDDGKPIPVQHPIVDAAKELIYTFRNEIWTDEIWIQPAIDCGRATRFEA